MKNNFYQSFDYERQASWGNSDDYRTPFQIDRDRVLHSLAFRKLQNKTQVFWSGEYDFYRTRLTHSLEVAQIGRSISYWLKSSSPLLRDDFFIDADLVEAICLSHDLGHPPFGHAGEKGLNYFMRDHGGFEGNAQTLRLLNDRLFAEKRDGMNPSRGFLDGVLKYKSLRCELQKSTGANPDNHFIYDKQAGQLDWAMGEMDFPLELAPGEQRDSFKSLECQIMDWADDTAYSLHDLVDSLRAGHLNREKIEQWGSQQDEHSQQILQPLLEAMQRGRVESFVARRIGEYIKACQLVEDSNFMSQSSNRYRFRLQVDENVQLESKVFKALAYQVVFMSPAIKQLEYKGNYMLEKLWNLLEERYVKGNSICGQDYALLPSSVAEEIEQSAEPDQRARLVCDYLASLTDGACARMYQRLFVPDSGSINDLML
ncbi:dGTP triphosphohydrolase [Persicirhabdus sediminis]|uniref:DNTP triphosphohydrolase n=1 Tax=Persicirhabdus sediminis TaxID=454144 RepID=A0A8J7MJ22_9BACT|nr:dNTP triphosphohydrolase [Persicirhabdus sediminis]MBK1791908.1 dNTP triphosphohydrolase [Persicirhabdus sediminis]